MSTVNATKVECDELTAKNGTGLPDNLTPLTPHCYGSAQKSAPVNTVNVSSIIVGAKSFVITMINDATNVNYTILCNRNGGGTDNTTSTAAYLDYTSGKTTSTFEIFCKVNGNALTSVNEFSFAVYDAGS